jgi:glyceraldehyde-3-phosphate dehydrogenase (NADP+)
MTSTTDIEGAIGRAHESFPATRALPSGKRAAILRQIGEGISRRREEFARSIVEEARKPIRLARGEVDRALLTFQLAAEEATRQEGETLPVDFDSRNGKAWCVVERFAKGPVAALTPFNFPLNLLAHKLAPAIACGCPIVAKPSPRTPGAARLLAEEVRKTDWPAEAFSLVVCPNDEAPKLWRDDRVAVVSFTGSDAVGWKIKEESPRKTVILELGGNAAAIVHRDTDIVEAARKLALSAFAHAGQVCIKAQRIFADEAVFDDFLRAFVEATRALPAGPLDDERTLLSPLIDGQAADRVSAWIAEARREGARLECGGERDGDFLAPALLTGVSHASHVWSDEVFGPVATLEPYRFFSEAIHMVNESRYGIHAAVFTHDLSRVLDAFRRIEAGGVIVNDAPSLRVDNIPYGGVKASGTGREGIRSAIAEYTEPKVLLVSSP